MDTVVRSRLSDIVRDFSGCPGERLPGDTLPLSQNAHMVVEAEWRAAIAALTQLLPTLPRDSGTDGDRPLRPEGLAISGPLPVLNEADFGGRLETWVVTPQPLADALQGQRVLLPAHSTSPLDTSPSTAMRILPLPLDTPLLTERFCILVTPALSVALVLGPPTGGQPCFQYSFDPQVLLALWQHIQQSVAETAQVSLESLDQRFGEILSPPDFRVITHFTQVMMAHLPHRRSTAVTMEERGNLQFSQWHNGHNGRRHQPPSVAHLTAAKVGPTLDGAVATPGPDAELLRAMAHEIRTPLTTIRTLTRSLLRRKDVTDEAKKRLSRIDEECTQQIDRFNLIFKAVELETMERERPRSALTPIALTQIFQDAIPRWQQQAQRRNLKLDVTLPPDLPRVTSDPTLLNEVLTGVVEWFTQCLPPQSHVHMHVMLAGHQLKLQFEADPIAVACSLTDEGTAKRQTMKSVGQLLTVVPETGGVSLNLDVTKNLFEFLGGKLILRQKPEQGEVLTAFLPLDTREV